MVMPIIDLCFCVNTRKAKVRPSTQDNQVKSEIRLSKEDIILLQLTNNAIQFVKRINFHHNIYE